MSDNWIGRTGLRIIRSL